MANEFIARKGLIVSGSTRITGSLNVSAGITGSLFGTGSWATNATSASFATTASAATSITFTPTTASFASTASFVNTLNQDVSATGNITAGAYLISNNSSGDEGGEILLAKPQTNTTLDGTGVTIDVYQNKLRIFEQGGSARGGYWDITTLAGGASTNLAGGAGTVTSITAGNGLTGGTITGAGTITVDTGSTHFTQGTVKALPNGTVSSSGQVSYTGLSNIPSGIVSSSTQITPLLPAGTVSSSGQVLYTGLSNIPAGILSSSTQINNLSGVSASFATTASYASNAELFDGLNSTVFATTGSNQFNGSQTITGSLLISGSGLALQVSGSGSVRDNFTVNGSTFFVDAGNNRVGVGTLTPNARLTVSGSTNITGSLDVTGAFTAQTKSFKILHQRLPGKSLIYGVLEGPEHAVYARGRLQNDTIITLPDEWEWLVDMDSVTVQLTPIGTHQKLYVSSIYGTRIVIANENLFSRDIDCYYTVTATRKDVQPLKTVE